MFLNSTWWTLFPLSCTTVQVGFNTTAPGQTWALLKFWVPSICNPGDLVTKFICTLLANNCHNTMSWIGYFNPEYSGPVRANTAPDHLSTHLAGEGPNNSQITAAKSYHEDHLLRWVSWDLNIFLKHSPNTSLHSRDAPLWNGNPHLLHYDPAGPLEEHRSDTAWSGFTHFTFYLSRFVIPVHKMHYLRYTVNWFYPYAEIISAFIAMRIYPPQLCSFSPSN